MDVTLIESSKQWVSESYGDKHPENNVNMNIYVDNKINSEYPHILLLRVQNIKDFLNNIDSELIGENISSEISISVTATKSKEETFKSQENESSYKDPFGEFYLCITMDNDNDGTIKWFFKKSNKRDELLEKIYSKNFFIDTTQEKQMDIQVCHKSEYGIATKDRKLDKLYWDEIKDNYSISVQEKMDNLINIDPSKLNGKIVILTGEPGTGKSHFIQSIATEWSDWCRTVYLWSPMSLFREESSLFSFMSSVESRTKDDGEEKWTVIVMEDTGDLVDIDGKLTPGFSSLLNATDGLIGQSLKALFLITSNEKIDRIHPAVRRPGRLQSHINIGKLSIEEAKYWGKKHGIEIDQNKDWTLAELFGILNENDVESIENKIGF